MRRDSIGGSDIASILGISPYKKAQKLWEEKTGLVEPEDISLLPHVLFGTQMESVIREKAEDRYAVKFPAITIQDNYLKGNLDGLSEDGIVLECKTVGREKGIEASLGQVPDYYLCQIDFYMHLAKANKAVYAAYCREADDFYFVEITRDQSRIDYILKKVDEFWHHVQTKTPLTHVDNEFESELNEWKIRKAALNNAEAAFSSIDEVIREKFKKLGCKSMSHSGVVMTMVERKGNVNYKKIPELKGVNLDKYRDESTTYVKVTCDEV